MRRLMSRSLAQRDTVGGHLSRAAHESYVPSARLTPGTRVVTESWQHTYKATGIVSSLPSRRKRLRASTASVIAILTGKDVVQLILVTKPGQTGEFGEFYSFVMHQIAAANEPNIS